MKANRRGEHEWTIEQEVTELKRGGIERPRMQPNTPTSTQQAPKAGS